MAAQKGKYDKRLGAFRDNDTQGFITFGENGILTVRWETSGGFVYDMTLNNDGDVVTTLVSSPSNPATGNLMLPWFFAPVTYS